MQFCSAEKAGGWEATNRCFTERFGWIMLPVEQTAGTMSHNTSPVVRVSEQTQMTQTRAILYTIHSNDISVQKCLKGLKKSLVSNYSILPMHINFNSVHNTGPALHSHFMCLRSQIICPSAPPPIKLRVCVRLFACVSHKKAESRALGHSDILWTQLTRNSGHTSSCYTSYFCPVKAATVSFKSIGDLSGILSLPLSAELILTSLLHSKF